jgi:hypothetical protein
VRLEPAKTSANVLLAARARHTTDADANREALTNNRIVAALAQGDVDDATKVEVSCDGFEQIQNIGREPSGR